MAREERAAAMEAAGGWISRASDAVAKAEEHAAVEKAEALKKASAEAAKAKAEAVAEVEEKARVDKEEALKEAAVAAAKAQAEAVAEAVKAAEAERVKAVALVEATQPPIIQSDCWHVAAAPRMQPVQSARWSASRERTVPAPPQAKGRRQ